MKGKSGSRSKLVPSLYRKATLTSLDVDQSRDPTGPSFDLAPDSASETSEHSLPTDVSPAVMNTMRRTQTM